MDSSATPGPVRMPWRAITWLAIASLVFIRNANAFLYPILFGEDGTRLFMYYQENRGLDGLFREYAGYVSFGANLIGWLVGAAPLVAQPYLLAINAGLIGVTCFWLFSSPRFAPILADVRLRCAACICMAALPVGNFALMTCTMFVNWHLLFAAALLALATPPRTNLGRIAEGGFVWLCLWTNPVSICLLPVYAWRTYRASKRGDRWLYGSLAGLAVLYPLLFVGGSGGPGTPMTPALAAAGTLLTERVLTEPFLGTTGRYCLSMSVLPGAVMWPAGVLGLFFFLRRRQLDADARHRLLAMGVLIVGMSIAIAYARYDQFEGMLHWGRRYTYVQKLLLYLAVLVSAFTACRRPLLLFAIFITHAVVLHCIDWRPYDTSRARGERMMTFVRDAAAWQADPHADGTSMVLSEPPRRIVIRRRRTTPATPR